MTPAGDLGSRAVVTPLRRPPVRQSVLILGCFAATLGTGAAGEEGIRDER